MGRRTVVLKSEHLVGFGDLAQLASISIFYSPRKTQKLAVRTLVLLGLALSVCFSAFRTTSLSR